MISVYTCIYINGLLELSVISRLHLSFIIARLLRSRVAFVRSSILPFDKSKAGGMYKLRKVPKVLGNRALAESRGF